MTWSLLKKIKLLLNSHKEIDKLSSKINRLEEKIDNLNFLIGNFYSLYHRNNPSDDFNKNEFRIFSQWGDDGIIQHLVQRLNIQNKTFIEFGVENYMESNTRFLLMKNNWKGLVFDGSEQNINQIKQNSFYWQYDLTACQAFITAENINTLIKENNFEGEIGILSIDIDGNDYWVWKAIDVVEPAIVIVEYNSIFGSEGSVTIPYDPNFYRTNAHYSNLYFGASLKALNQLANEKGYFLAGCTSSGNNAYFVHNKYKGLIPVQAVNQAYVESASRESRDITGNLTFTGGNNRFGLIKGLPVINVETNMEEKL